MVNKSPKKSSKKSPKQLKNKLDKVFADYIKKRDSDYRGYASCISCGRTFHISEMDAGHYISRRHHSVRWEETNCHAQCRCCNRFRNGALDSYALALIRKYGKDILFELEKKKNENKVWKLKELEELLDHYKKLSVG